MNIAQIKTQIGQPILNMARQLEEGTGNPTPWISHWDNENRVRVTMHEEVFAKIKENPGCDVLAVKTEIVKATEEREEYTRHIVITPKQLLATF